MNLPEVLAGDMNEVYQTAHIDDRLVDSLRSISGRDPWLTGMKLIICHLELHNFESRSVEMHP